MELYPVQKILKEKEIKSLLLEPASAKIKSNSQLSSPERAFVKHEDPVAVLYESKRTKTPSKRHDRDYTVSWIERQQARRRSNIALSPILRKPVKDFQLVSTTSIPNSTVNDTNRRFVVHLASEKDQEIYKVPLYQNNTFDLRKKNEEKVKEIFTEKEEYRREYNKLAQDNRFRQFRSSSMVNMESRRNAAKKANGTASRLFSNSELKTRNSTINDRIENEEDDFTIKGTSVHFRNNHFSNNVINSFKDKPNEPRVKLLEGLQEIYQKDLEEKKEELAKKQREAANGTPLKLRNYRNYMEDEKLMSRLKNPFKNKLPFNKPINGSIWQRQVKELSELEIKAEVLRNIKMINDTIKKEVTINRKISDSTSSRKMSESTASRKASEAFSSRKVSEDIAVDRDKGQITFASFQKKPVEKTGKDIEIFSTYFGKKEEAKKNEYLLLKVKPIKVN